MLRSLDPVMDAISGIGWTVAIGFLRFRIPIAIILSVALGLQGRRITSFQGKAACIALIAALWAQAAVFSDLSLLGGFLFLLSFVFAYATGRRSPFAPDRPRRDIRVATADLIAIPVLLLLSVSLRLYALEAIPWFVDVEPGSAFLQSLSPHGLGRYVTHNRVSDDGIAHMIGRFLSVSAFGPSILSLRGVGVFFGSLSVVLFYLLARQFCSPVYALWGAALLAVDPVQLFWSRIEASQIIASTTAALIGGFLAIWLARSWSLGASVATMVWMPVTRYFYAATLGLVILPALVTIGGVLTHRVRQTLCVTAFISLGLIGWAFSSSMLNTLAGGRWQYTSPLNVYGRPMFEPHDPENAFINASAMDKVILQFRRGVANTIALVSHMNHDRAWFSNWLMMAQPDDNHRRSVNAAVFALLVPSIGYLLSRFSDPMCRAVLVWLALLILPGILSTDPEPRRVAGAMAGIYLPVTIFVAQVWPLLFLWRRRGQEVLIATAVVIGLTGVSSHLLSGRQEAGYSRYIEFLAPVFARFDTIIHNIEDEAAVATLMFGNAHIIRNELPCLRLINPSAERLPLGVNPVCEFESPLYRDLLTEGSIRARQLAYTSKSIAVVLEMRGTADGRLRRELIEDFAFVADRTTQLDLPPHGTIEIAVLVKHAAASEFSLETEY